MSCAVSLLHGAEVCERVAKCRAWGIRCERQTSHPAGAPRCAAPTARRARARSYAATGVTSVVTSATTAGGRPGWLPNNLNQGRLDLYYTVLVLLSAANVLFFLLVAHFYQYKQVLPYPLSRQAPLPVRDCALFVLARPAGARAPGSLGSVVPASSWWRE